ncbi:MAG: hypothetical protein ABIY52_03495 [Gemmatimonadaceae bacterium]
MKSRGITAATYVFFAAFLLVGLLVFRDYGISWDEIPTRRFGIMYVDNMVPDAAALDSVRAAGGPAYERFGPLFEILLVRTERALQPIDIRTTFFVRHLLTFLVFFVGVLCFNALCRRRFRPGIALLATVFLAASPQLFAHAFYNVKDISFLTMFVATILTLDSVLLRPEWRTMLMHVLTTLLLLGTRVLGGFAMVLTGLAALARRPAWRTLGLLVAYGVCVAVLLPLVWPVLQIDYFGIVRDAVAGSTSNPYRSTNLFRGQVYQASDLPRDYVPTWMLVTTPPVITLLFLAGTISALADFIKRPRDYVSGDRQRDLIVLAWFFLPVVGCMVLRPVLYDGWRHLFFVYPALVYIAALGMERIRDFAVARAGESRAALTNAALAGAVMLCLAPALVFMARNHPFEHLYYNRFAGSDMKAVRQRFETDYWGLTYRPSLEYIMHTDRSPHVRIFVATYPGRLNVAMLEPDDRARVEIVGSEGEADYVVTSYRYHPQDYPFPREVFAVRVGDASMGSVFDVRALPPSATPRQ